MAEAKSNVALKKEDQAPERKMPTEWEPLDTLRRQVDRMFEDFGRGFGLWRPFGGSLFDMRPSWAMEEGPAKSPAVDLVEKDKEYEISAELPGMDASNIEVKLSNGVLTIKGEKQEEKEEKKKDYYLSERRYGSFQRSFQLPEGIDEEKIEANFDKGVLTIKLPKGAEAQKPEKKIAIETK
jgi:HSP20 family protein